MQFLRPLQRKDEQAFQKFVEEHQEKVFNICWMLVKNDHDAEDLSQEVFVEVFFSANQFRGESALFTWVYKIAVNKSLNFLKKKKRKKRMMTLLGRDKSKTVDFHHPAILMEDKEKARAMSFAIDKLPDDQRIAFTLSTIQEIRYQKIADIMGRSLASVEGLIHRAKKRMRDLLNKYYEKHRS